MCFGNLPDTLQIVGSVQDWVSDAKRKQSVRQLGPHGVVVLRKIIDSGEIQRQAIPDDRPADVRIDRALIERRPVLNERIPGVQRIVFEYRHEVSVPCPSTATLEHFGSCAACCQASGSARCPGLYIEGVIGNSNLLDP